MFTPDEGIGAVSQDALKSMLRMYLASRLRTGESAKSLALFNDGWKARSGSSPQQST